MTSDDIRCQLMTSDVLLLNFPQIVVKIFHGEARRRQTELSVCESVCESVCLCVNLWFIELLDAAKKRENRDGILVPCFLI